MIEIWRERIVKLKAIRTGALYNSIIPLRMAANADASDVSFTWGFAEYGPYVARGTGRATPIGNSGDIGRAKIREAKPWLDKAFYSSAMNLKEFMAASMGREAIEVLSNAFADPITGRITL